MKSVSRIRKEILYGLPLPISFHIYTVIRRIGIRTYRESHIIILDLIKTQICRHLRKLCQIFPRPPACRDFTQASPLASVTGLPSGFVSANSGRAAARMGSLKHTIRQWYIYYDLSIPASLSECPGCNVFRPAFRISGPARECPVESPH